MTRADRERGRITNFSYVKVLRLEREDVHFGRQGIRVGKSDPLGSFQPIQSCKGVEVFELEGFSRRTKSSGVCTEKADQEEDLKPWVLILYLRISSQKALRFFMASFAALLMFPWFAARSPWM